jgi:hypothetical protein
MAKWLKTSEAIIEENLNTTEKQLKLWLPHFTHGVHYEDRRLPNRRKAFYFWCVDAILELWHKTPQERENIKPKKNTKR